MSLPHGKPIDDVVDQLEDHLNEGDICIDGANEHYQATERRQERMKRKGIRWIGSKTHSLVNEPKTDMTCL